MHLNKYLRNIYGSIKISYKQKSKIFSKVYAMKSWDGKLIRGMK